MNAILKLLLLGILVLLLSHDALGQTIHGTVQTQDGRPLEDVVVLASTGEINETDAQGKFELEVIADDSIFLEFSKIGYRTQRMVLDAQNRNEAVIIALTTDPLQLETVIVTGTAIPRSKRLSTIAISSMDIDEIQQRHAIGSADLLKSIPGVFADGSAGEVFTRVYTRGISALAEDDHGWYYVSLQEDGLPVSLSQHKFFSPDLFYRADLMTKSLEAVRGGGTAITAPNAPGAIFNFTAREGLAFFEGDVHVKTGIQGAGNMFYRSDLAFSGPLKKNWFYAVGGHFRYDEGPRETDFRWSEGGQLKFNLRKEWKHARLKFYGKWLDDLTNRYTGLAATHWEGPQAAFGQDFNTSAIMIPSFSGVLPDGRQGAAPGTIAYDPANGIQVQDKMAGVTTDLKLNNTWTLNAQFKYSDKKAEWQSSIGNQPIGLESFLAYFLSSFDSPWGQVVFRDARSDQVLASVNNIGALNAFEGLPPTFEYLGGSLPNDALQGTGTWYKEDASQDLMGKVQLDFKHGTNDASLGLFYGNADVSSFTTASYAYATYENNSRMLSVSLENPGTPTILLSDNLGLSNYGGLFYENGRADIRHLAPYFSYSLNPFSDWRLELGLRYEFIKHSGSKDRFGPISRAGGLDGDTLTGYDNGQLASTGAVDPFEYSYSPLSYSIGINYLVSEKASAFFRFGKGNKVPEISYYLNNFSNVPVGSKGPVQQSDQLEAGIKWRSDRLHVFATAFYSQLSNIAFSEFVFDQNTGSVFFTPPQINKTRTAGVELEAVFTLLPSLSLQVTSTIQNAESTVFTVYDAQGTTDPEDDMILDYSGNTLPHNPSFTLEIQPKYLGNRFSLYGWWRYLGAREGNLENAFQLPGFSTIDLGGSYQITEQLTAGVHFRNALNSTGLMNFFGPNSFGSNANQASGTYIAANPEASFVVFPVLPRSGYLTLGFSF